MIYLAVLISQSNFGHDIDNIVGVYDCLTKAEARVARLKQKLGRYGYTFRIDVRSLNQACRDY